MPVLPPCNLFLKKVDCESENWLRPVFRGHLASDVKNYGQFAPQGCLLKLELGQDKKHLHPNYFLIWYFGEENDYSTSCRSWHRW